MPLEERHKIHFDHPEALDTNPLVEHLEQLQTDSPVEVPIYDFTIHTRRKKTRRVEPRGVTLVGGILIFADKALRELMDIKIFVDTDADTRFTRRLQRDITERGWTMER